MKTISPGRKAIVAILVLLSVISLGVGVSVILGFSGNATSSDIRESSRRADCRSAYNADFTEVIRARDDLKLDADAQYYRATYNQTVNGIPPTVEQKQHFGETLDALDVARARVRALPKIDDAVDHGYTLNGVHHPPCPG